MVILGYAREGRAMVDVLKQHVPSAEIIITDEKQIDAPEYRALADTIAQITSDTIVIKTPGIPWHREYVVQIQAIGARITSSTNFFFAERASRFHHRAQLSTIEHAHNPIIGITGTKGKSTTSSLLAHVLRAAGKRVVLAGNIGEPAIAHIDEPDDTIFVLEMSSYQLFDLEIAPHIAVILNLYEEHMDWHGDVARYHAAKMRIAEQQVDGDVFIYNEKFPQLVDLASRVQSKAIPFADRFDEALGSLTLLGDHNKLNAAAVLTVCDVLGIARAVTSSAFASFVPLPHRLQDLGVVRGVQFVNDSFSTTPRSALAAIDVYRDRLGAIILGGHDRGYDFAELARVAVSTGARIYLLQNAARLEVAIRAAGGEPIMISTFPEIVADVIDHVTPGSACVLSPASPSFGQFQNFVERGEKFIAAVDSAR